MLDQNTDRMWYVIGAVIVGAALIFLMNSTFPTLFANIGETFEEKVGETTEMTDGIMPVTKPRKNYLLDSELPQLSSNGEYTDYYLDVDEIHELRGQTITVSFEAKSENNDVQYLDTYLRSHDGNLSGHEKSERFTLSREYQRFTTTLVVPDLTNWLDYDLSLRFRGNEWVTGNEPIYKPYHGYFTTRRVKLELGTQDTGYIPHDKDE